MHDTKKKRLRSLRGREEESNRSTFIDYVITVCVPSDSYQRFLYKAETEEVVSSTFFLSIDIWRFSSHDCIRHFPMKTMSRLD